MSPTEFELRAALRDGEGRGPDPDTIIRRANDLRRQRRTRIGGSLAAAAVVAGLAVAGGVLLGRQQRERQLGEFQRRRRLRDAALRIRARPAPPRRRHARRGRSGVGRRVPPDAPPARAPRRWRHRPVRFHRQPAAGGRRQRHVLLLRPERRSPAAGLGHGDGADAAEVASTLNAAAPLHQGVCPDYRTLSTQQYVLLGANADGTLSDPVVVTLARNPCQDMATNGTAVRYGWTPPTTAGLPGADGETATPAPTHS